ncbi:MAG: L-seryl-tRNA(Sec) selenium transferase [Pseudomonadota bacterium]
MSQTQKNEILRHLPGVDHLLTLTHGNDLFENIPRSVILDSIRKAIDTARKDILNTVETNITDDLLLLKAQSFALEKIKPKLVNLINATGVVLHTNLGRSLLCEDALDNIQAIARSYSNLELNIDTGKRGIRYQAVEELICELTGAQSAIAVNNNAGAVLLCLNTMAKDRQVVVSRGELVEIGGSFRIPDVMSKSGGILKEVGTTNRTHLRDFENAICDQTGLFLKVHTSNYTIQGFTADVSLKELVDLGHSKNIPIMEDLGSGTLIDFSRYGLPSEPTVSDSVRTGADIVTFSGDKLLGGPQAGIIVGKKETIEQIKSNPLTRALRIDKLTLGALESTLKLYRDESVAIRKIPTLRMLTMPLETIRKRADSLLAAIVSKTKTRINADLADMNSRPGGGSFPELNLPTRCVTLEPKEMSVSRFEKHMRLSTPAIIGRIEDNRYILDPRTIQDGQEDIISSTIARILA